MTLFSRHDDESIGYCRTHRIRVTLDGCDYCDTERCRGCRNPHNDNFADGLCEDCQGGGAECAYCGEWQEALCLHCLPFTMQEAFEAVAQAIEKGGTP